MYKTLLLFLMLAAGFVVPSFADDVVTRGLDEYARANDLALANISTVKHSIVASSNKEKVTPGALRKAHEFEFGMEHYAYTYRETVDSAEFMRMEGAYNGVLLTYTFRPVDVDSLSQMIVNMFRAEVRYASGQVDYTGSGSWDGLKDFMYEMRALVGYEHDINPSLRVMPYAGLGYRYLNNGSEAMAARIIDGDAYYSGYNRESKYYYIPVGVQVYQKLAGGWGLGVDLEYDFWSSGKQISHFEDMEDTGGANAGYDAMKNRQNKGFGLRGSLKIDKALTGMTLRIEPYYRYWKIEDSEVGFMTKGGALVPVPGMPGYFEAGLEPENTTQEIGVRMGLKF